MQIYIHCILLVLINLVKSKFYLVELQDNHKENVDSPHGEDSGDYGSQPTPCMPGYPCPEKEKECSSRSGWRWFDHTGKCYKYYYGGYWELQEAKDLCKKEVPSSYQGNLASIPDSKTNEFLKEWVPTQVWIGASKSGGGWSWEDGTTWSYTSWRSGEPKEDYATFWRGKWISEQSSSGHCFLCSY